MPFGIDPNAIAPSPALERQTMIQRQEMAAGERARANQTALAQAELAANRAARANASAIQQQQFQAQQAAQQQAMLMQDALSRKQIDTQAALDDSKMRLEQAKIAKSTLLEEMGISAAERAAKAQHDFLKAQADLDRASAVELLNSRLSADQAAAEQAQRFQMEQVLPAEQAFLASESAATRAATLEQERMQTERAGAAQREVSARELTQAQLKAQSEIASQARQGAMVEDPETGVKRYDPATYRTIYNQLMQDAGLMEGGGGAAGAAPAPPPAGGPAGAPAPNWEERAFTSLVERGKGLYRETPSPAVLDTLLQEAKSRYGMSTGPEQRDMLARAIGISITDPNDPAYQFRLAEARAGRGGGTRRPTETLFGSYLTPGHTPGRNQPPLWQPR